MKRLLIIPLAISLAVLHSYAQGDFAVIKDPDGYTNVRESNLQSKIVGKIQKYELFDCMDSKDVKAKPITDMIFVDYYEYITKKGCDYLQNKLLKPGEDRNVNPAKKFYTSAKSGYVYKNCIQRLKDLPSLKQVLETKKKAILKNDSLEVCFEFAKFVPKNHIIKDYENKRVTVSNDVKSIDGEEVWGTVGMMPHTEIKSITVTYKDTVLVFPKNSIRNLYLPRSNPKVYIGLDGELYVWMENSDGAGVYHVIWVVIDKEIKYRLTQYSFYI
jgi:hypothetical protein